MPVAASVPRTALRLLGSVPPHTTVCTGSNRFGPAGAGTAPSTSWSVVSTSRREGTHRCPQAPLRHAPWARGSTSYLDPLHTHDPGRMYTHTTIAIGSAVRRASTTQQRPHRTRGPPAGAEVEGLAEAGVACSGGGPGGCSVARVTTTSDRPLPAA